MTQTSKPHIVNATPQEWRAQLNDLPSLEQTNGKVPSFFLAHGQPGLIWPPTLPARDSPLAETQGPDGPLANFLKDLGPKLIDLYKPKAIVVFSAHWETRNGTLVSDYGDENPLLMDYFGFPKELYQIKFQSKGDHEVAQRVVDLLKQAGKPARLTTKLEARGDDGRGFKGPGLDHGVFVPFKLMFSDECSVPIVQVSIDSSLDPEAEYALGAALEPLRSEGVLIVSGGLTIHTFRDFGAFSPKTASEVYTSFEQSIVDAAAVVDASKREKALKSLVHHPGFRSAHPREEHFVPLYIAAGACDKSPETRARTIFGAHGCKTIAFGV
ncbi:hypothetical protein OIO90_006270 [Microbotryomycetes sp. JL221]|nr:hypothetical protein OIO90_006270 [Microbotryomycetes sp. JL221]